MKTVGIVAFAFGAPESILPNQHIARMASQKARELNAPVCTQLDVRVEPGVDVCYIFNDGPDNPPPTLRIARNAIRWAKQQGFTKLLVIAAKPHLSRCLRDLRRAAREIGMQTEIRACKEIEQYPEDEWFCSDSTQARTRSKKDWQKRECILKLMPFFVYKLVAS